MDTYLPYVNRSEVLIQFANGTEVKGSFFPSQNSVDTGSPSPGAWVFVDGNLMPPCPPPPTHAHHHHHHHPPHPRVLHLAASGHAFLDGERQGDSVGVAPCICVTRPHSVRTCPKPPPPSHVAADGAGPLSNATSYSCAPDVTQMGVHGLYVPCITMLVPNVLQSLQSPASPNPVSTYLVAPPAPPCHCLHLPVDCGVQVPGLDQ